jgi:hypothetical protein
LLDEAYQQCRSVRYDYAMTKSDEFWILAFICISGGLFFTWAWEVKSDLRSIKDAIRELREMLEEHAKSGH